MNTDHDHELEIRVDRALKSLPPLSAPPTLAPRVLARIATRTETPWYQRAWPTWPMALRTASFVLLLAVFGALCFGGWKAAHSSSVTAATEKVSGAVALISLAANTLSVLGTAATEVIRHLGTGFFVAGGVVVLLAYVACVGFGSFYFRFAFARR